MNPFIRMIIEHDVDIYNIKKNLKTQKMINKLILLNIILICVNIHLFHTKINYIEQTIALDNYKRAKMKGRTKSEDEEQKGE